MEKYLQILKRTKLFHNLTDKETLSALDCLNATVKKYKKGSTLFSEGDDAKFVSVVLSGEIEVRKSVYMATLILFQGCSHVKL